MSKGGLFVVVTGRFTDGFRFSAPMEHGDALDAYMAQVSLKPSEIVEVMVPEGGIQDPDGHTFLVRGDPILEGFEVIGPFTNMQDAVAYGSVKEEGNWWVFTAEAGN
jgi:hypothetical protein